MATVIPKFQPGQTITGHASAAITGGRMVTISGAPVGGNVSVGVPAAAAKVFGVAAEDAASGAKVGIYHGPGMIVPIEAGATLAAGDIIESDASGRAIVRVAGIPCGVVVEGAEAAALALVDFRPASL